MRILSMLIMLACPLICVATTQADAAYASLLTRLQNSRGVSMKFTASGAGANARGTAVMKGAKFNIQMTDGSAVWCDGKNLWTYNPRSKETTLTTPSPSELAEVNPIIAILRNPTLFKPALIKSAGGGNVIELSPTKGKAALGFSKIWVRLKTDGSPASVRTRTADGKQASIKIESFAAANAGESNFRYPAAKYKGVQVLDLR